MANCLFHDEGKRDASFKIGLNKGLRFRMNGTWMEENVNTFLYEVDVWESNKLDELEN